MLDYQRIFDQTYTATDSNEYGQLVYSLEAVFKAAGYDITGQELAGAQHCHIVSSVGCTDLAAIARSFIAWVHTDQRPGFALQQIIDAYLPLRCHDWRQGPRLAAGTLLAWQNSLSTMLQEARIRRNTKKYTAFIADRAASPRNAELMRQAGAEAIAAHRQDIGRIAQEIASENAKALASAAHLRRTAHIITAFCAVTGQADTQDKAGQLTALAERVEHGAAHRQTMLDEALQQPYAVDEVVACGVKFMPDLNALWVKITETPTG